MNIIRKIAHRGFNLAMRLLLPLFPYREPEILDDVNAVLTVLKSNGTKRVLLVAGKTVRGRGLTAQLEELMANSGIEIAVYDGYKPDPTSDNVEEARELYINAGCEAIIAFGGGSAIDLAKAVGARIVRPNTPLRKMAGLIKIRKRLPLFIAIPTTAGTGSETTVASVILDAKTHHKYVISDFCLIPHYTLLDPSLTVGLPKHLTATTGMDALTHAVEAFIGRSTTRETRRASIEAVRLIFDNLERAYENGEDVEARRNMLRASYLAGTAFTRSYVGYVHAIAHTLGGKYGISHGFANASLLPVVLRAYGKGAVKPLATLARAVGIADDVDLDEVAAELFISRIEEMNARMEIPAKLDCIKAEDIPAMARLADREANPLYPVPVLWDAKELEEIYRLIMPKGQTA
jgi:alcohol dehydrogenase class IV